MEEKEGEAIEALTKQVTALTELLEKNITQDSSHKQTIYHVTEGVGNWGVAAVVACFCTWLALIVFLVIFVPEIHDLRAWRDIHSNEIGTLKSEVTKLKPH